MKTASKKNNRSGSRGVIGKSKKTTTSSREASRSRSLKSGRSKSSAKSKSLGKKQELSDTDALKKLLHGMLKDTLNAEKQLVKALPKMEKAATSKQLASAFKKHLSETEKQVKRLEKVFTICDLKIVGKKCEAMEGLVKEGKEAIDETPKGSLVRDVALIVAAQKVEHYEIAAYGSLRSIAEVCGFSKAVELLQQTLDEEAETDKKLTALSESLNPKASGEAGSKIEAKRKSDSNKVEDAVYMEEETRKDKEEEEGDEFPDSYDEDDDDLEEAEDTDDDEDDSRTGLGKSL